VTDFDRLYAQSTDPWHIEHRWYERRKRAAILAAMPFEITEVIVELGCGTGIFSQLLAQRCRQLLACDICAAAIGLAEIRLAEVDNITLSRQEVPRQWPVEDPQSVDCVVICELGYYLQPADMAPLVHRIGVCLKPAGVVIACHWKGAFLEQTMSSEAFHDGLSNGLALQTLVHHEEQDFLLNVWSRDGRSVAAQEGFA